MDITNSAFWPAVWIGLSIAAPVGPIGMLVIQRTLRHGLASGLATGLGAAVADAAYGAVGAFGVTALVSWLQGARVPLVVAGGAFLLVLAWRTWRTAPAAEWAAERAAEQAAAGTMPTSALALWSAFAGTFLLTLSNPATVLSFMAIFGTLAAQLTGPADPLLMVAGVLLGSALWWLLLCAAVARLRRRFDARAQRGVARLSALMLAGFALWQWAALAQVVRTG